MSNSINKNLIVFSLVAVFAVVFSFHWFFVANLMPVAECFSVECLYSAPQAMPAGYQNFSVLVVIFSVLVFLTLFSFNNKFKELPGRRRVLEKVPVFDYKINSWLKILEKRDPNRAF